MDDFYEYKAAKEEWVTGHSGSSIYEVAWVNIVCLVGYWLWLTAKTFFEQGQAPRTETKSVGAFLVTYFLFCVPMTLSCVAIPYRWAMMAGMTLIGFYFFVNIRPVPTPKHPAGVDNSQAKAHATAGAGERRAYISVYRAVLMILTCVSILAVDFSIFPRSYAKVETFGSSLMDIGVGSFVFSAGLVSARAYLPTIQRRDPTPTLRTQLLAALRSSLYLFLLGFGRLLTVKGSAYQEHVTEYGVHWNFFFTLGLLPIPICLVQALLPYPAVTSTLLAVGYQLALTYGGLQDYIMHAPRTDLISMNREGLLGFIGYLSLSLGSLAVGKLMFADLRTWSDNTRQLGRLIMHSLALWALFCILYYGFGMDISRRLVNLPYILWTASFNLSYVTGFYILEYVVHWKRGAATVPEHDPNTPWGLAAFNRYGLTCFLVANIMTGIINMSMRTLYTPAVTSLGILLAHIAIVQLYTAVRAS
ncbi:Glucosaminyl phosphatidylinositol (GlcN-PI) nositol acylation protein [Tieghemiomyces parasiticus]|uniref:GPI-anchored wall transfer protein n=1 Tax=Tieghemiomyces parasiticus TaxID=78921 RepID=A0A9W7ZTM8_9FUNG|nr:Glucosaminyl phosphatidylinositol (GlcN-PI) nositol acylation protein [Tieghemiomyces parasiticus]